MIGDCDNVTSFLRARRLREYYLTLLILCLIYSGEHCITETESCYQTCGNAFIGVLDDNVLNATREDSEAQCRKVRDITVMMMTIS